MTRILPERGCPVPSSAGGEGSGCSVLQILHPAVLQDAERARASVSWLCWNPEGSPRRQPRCAIRPALPRPLCSLFSCRGHGGQAPRAPDPRLPAGLPGPGRRAARQQPLQPGGAVPEARLPAGLRRPRGTEPPDSRRHLPSCHCLGLGAVGWGRFSWAQSPGLCHPGAWAKIFWGQAVGTGAWHGTKAPGRAPSCAVAGLALVNEAASSAASRVAAGGTAARFLSQLPLGEDVNDACRYQSVKKSFSLKQTLG